MQTPSNSDPVHKVGILAQAHRFSLPFWASILGPFVCTMFIVPNWIYFFSLRPKSHAPTVSASISDALFWSHRNGDTFRPCHERWATRPYLPLFQTLFETAWNMPCHPVCPTGTWTKTDHKPAAPGSKKGATMWLCNNISPPSNKDLPNFQANLPYWILTRHAYISQLSYPATVASSRFFFSFLQYSPATERGPMPIFGASKRVAHIHRECTTQAQNMSIVWCHRIWLLGRCGTEQNRHSETQYSPNLDFSPKLAHMSVLQRPHMQRRYVANWILQYSSGRWGAQCKSLGTADRGCAYSLIASMAERPERWERGVRQQNGGKNRWFPKDIAKMKSVRNHFDPPKTQPGTSENCQGGTRGTEVDRRSNEFGGKKQGPFVETSGLFPCISSKVALTFGERREYIGCIYFFPGEFHDEFSNWTSGF